MKKNLLTAFTGMFLLLAISVTANSQLSFIQVETQRGLVFDETSDFNSSNIEPTHVTPKAVKSFAKNFKNASDEKWYETSNSFVAKFTSDEIAYRIDYDKKGHWLYTIRTYDETKLPQDVRNMVKSTYFDYSITLVQEIEMPAKMLTYIIHLDGKGEIINLRVSDGEMDEWQKFAKSK
jgi:hypothetical protein